MRIGIDTHFLERKYGGLATFSKGILEELSNINNENEYILFFQGRKPEKLTNLIKLNRLSQQLPTYQPSIKKLPWFFWFNFIFPQQLRKYRIDLFFSANHFLPLIKLVEKEVITVHDLAWKINPKWKNFSYRAYASLFQQTSLRRADKIITISHSTKRDIMRFYNMSEDKIEVIYEGADKRYRPRNKNNLKLPSLLSKIKKIYNLPRKFILYVGKLEERKNIKGLLEIAKRLNSLNSKRLIRDLKLVLVGGIGKPMGKGYLKKIHRRPNILYLEDVNNKHLPLIYNLAKVFLLLSFYEGFGLTVLEAMQSGVPVLASNTSSLPEVVGDGGIMHNPTDYEGFIKDLVRLLENEKLYEKMQRKAIEQAKKFSWGKTTQKIVNIFNQI